MSLDNEDNAYRAPSVQEPIVSGPVAPARPWGPWASLGWTVLCVVVMFGIQIVALIAYVAVNVANGNRVDPIAVSKSALLLSVATLISTPAVVGMVTLLIRIRHCNLRQYLALGIPTARQAALALGGLAVLLAATDLTSYLLGRPLVPEVMVDIFRTGWLPLLLFAVVIAAPIGEEVLFRGFLFQGIASSRWGPWVAIAASSIGWASLHIQYDLYMIGTILIMGFYLGEVRRRTSSLPLTVLLHGVANTVATIEVMIMNNGQG